MFQEISPHIYHNEYKNRQPDKYSKIILIQDHQYFYLEDFPEYINGYHYTYLFMIDDIPYFTIDHQEYNQYTKQYPEYHWIPLRQCKNELLRYIVATASSLICWYTTFQYCPVCKEPLQKDTAERKLYCPHCHYEQYPIISPAVIVGVIYNNSILMTRYPNGKFYALVAGFHEIGETIEETVKREVFEETGIHVTNFKYYKSQPWPYSNSLLMGFYCEAIDHDITVDHHELEEALWVKQEDVKERKDTVSLTSEMIQVFKKTGRNVLL